MKARAFVLGLATALCALPLLAQDIPAGEDVWDSLGGGATEITLSPAQWNTLCGASVGANTSAQLKGFNIPGEGTGDTIVNRLDDAILPGIGSSDTVRIQLQDLSMVNDGPNPCTALGYSLRVTDYGSQAIGSMTIKKTSADGGTFTAKVPVSAVIQAVDGSGNPSGSLYTTGTLGDDSDVPWSYAAPTEAAVAAAAAAPWHPSVNPATGQPVRTCRRGNKTLPARHCYQPTPPCSTVVKNPVGGVGGVGADAAIGDDTITPIDDTAEKCTVADANPIGTVN